MKSFPILQEATVLLAFPAKLPCKHIFIKTKTRRKQNEEADCTAAGYGHGSGPGCLRRQHR
jgi:hypothetical protein